MQPPVSQQQGDKKQDKEEPDLTENADEWESIDQQPADSTEVDSVSKYNFIFEFLYRLKYSEEEGVEMSF